MAIDVDSRERRRTRRIGTTSRTIAGDDGCAVADWSEDWDSAATAGAAAAATAATETELTNTISCFTARFS